MTQDPALSIRYVADAQVNLTEEDYRAAIARIEVPMMMLLHAAMDLCEEAGEVIGPIKKAIIYGKELPKEELF